MERKVNKILHPFCALFGHPLVVKHRPPLQEVTIGGFDTLGYVDDLPYDFCLCGKLEHYDKKYNKNVRLLRRRG